MMNVRDELPAMARAAWRVRENAHLRGPTKVGAAVLGSHSLIYVGCNIEHRFRAHDVHAEVNALTNMAAHGDGNALAIVIAAEREFFTPCGGCMDWIFELGSPETIVAFSGKPDSRMASWRASELMPHYPH